MANKNRYTAQQVADALTETKGMMFIAAQRLGCSQETIRTYCNRYPSVQAAKDAQRGIMIDTAELKLWQSIQNGEAWGITLCLKTIGKDRGYVERLQADVTLNIQAMAARVAAELGVDVSLLLAEAQSLLTEEHGGRHA